MKGFVNSVTVPMAGTYGLRIGPNAVAGAAVVRFYRPFDQQGTITVGGAAVRIGVSTPGSAGRLTFTGTIGSSIYVEASASTIPDECGAFRLLDPSGTEVGSSGCIISGAGSLNYGSPVTLTSTGTYTILFDPDKETVGQATFRVYL